MRKFEFKKTFEEVEIAGKVYRIELNDDKIREYQEEIYSLEVDIQELLNVDETKLTKEEREKRFEKEKQLACRVLDMLLGEGSFDELYEKSGRSIINMYNLVEFLAEIVNERSAQNREERRRQYVKPKRRVDQK